jgi:hypothetical protein
LHNFGREKKEGEKALDHREIGAKPANRGRTGDEPRIMEGKLSNAQEGMLGDVVAAHATQLFGRGFRGLARAPATLAAAFAATPDLIPAGGQLAFAPARGENRAPRNRGMSPAARKRFR